MRGMLASNGTTAALATDKGIEGITPDNDFINKLLCPDVKVEGSNKKGPARAFLTQLAHKAETRWGKLLLPFNIEDCCTIPAQIVAVALFRKNHCRIAQGRMSTPHQNMTWLLWRVNS